MSLIAFFLIVSSATLHATWNLLAKKSKATLPFYATVSSVATMVWVHAFIWTPIKFTELPAMFWLMALGSVASDVIYAVGLVRCYKTMEMSTAYPMMRSLPLLLTAIITSVLGLGNSLTVQAVLGMVIVFSGCMMIPFEKFSDIKPSRYLDFKMLFLLVVACGTTGYTIFDSQAQSVLRECVAGVPKAVVSITYYVTRGVALQIALWSIIFATKEGRENAASMISNREYSAVFAGLAASGTYVLVLLAMNYVSNVSYVQVFRQIGLLIGVAAGIIILKEKCTLPKLIGVFLIIIGLILTVI